MHHNIKKGVNNKTFYLDGIYYRRGDWNISYADIEVIGDHGIIWGIVHFGIRNRYESDIVLADPRPLLEWRYEDTKMFSDSIDFIKRVSKYLGY